MGPYSEMVFCESMRILGSALLRAHGFDLRTKLLLETTLVFGAPSTPSERQLRTGRFAFRKKLQHFASSAFPTAFILYTHIYMYMYIYVSPLSLCVELAYSHVTKTWDHNIGNVCLPSAWTNSSPAADAGAVDGARCGQPQKEIVAVLRIDPV